MIELFQKLWYRPCRVSFYVPGDFKKQFYKVPWYKTKKKVVWELNYPKEPNYAVGYVDVFWPEWVTLNLKPDELETYKRRL